MKNFKVLIGALMFLFAFSACNNDDPDDPIAQPSSSYAVLNNGNWGANDACVTLFDMNNNAILDHVFLKENGQQLGDLGQDMIKVGNEIYVAVNGSQVIFVTDTNYNLKQKIVAEKDGNNLSPRSFCLVGDVLYVTYYEGYLGEINTKNYSIRLTPVGMNPEGVAYAKGKLYVANSGGLNYQDGYDNTISVVDASTFKEEKKIKVNVNPQTVVADENQETIYVNSFGNYDDVQAKLQSISLSTGEVSDLDFYDVKGMAKSDQKDDVLYVVTGSYNENWEVLGTVNVYNMRTHEKHLSLIEGIQNYYSVSIAGGIIFVGTSDYKTNGDVFMYDKYGQHLGKFDANGLNPIRVIQL